MNILFQNRNAMKIKILRYHNVIENWNLQIMEEIKRRLMNIMKLAMITLNPELNKRDVLINSVMGLCGESEKPLIYVKNGWRKDMNWTRNIWPRNLEI